MYLSHYSLLFTCIISLLLGCSSTDKILERGDYVAVINKLDYKAAKGTLPTEDVSLLQIAINKKLERERLWLGKKLISSDGEDWIEGYQKLDEIVDLQAKYSSFSQIDARKVNWIDIQKWDVDFSDLLNVYHTENYNNLYQEYLETKNKNYLIEAYYELDRVAHFAQGAIHVDSLQSIFKEEGVRKINLEFKDESFNMFELRHLRFYLGPSDSQWSNFGKFENPDFTAYVILDELDKDERKVENQLQYSREITIDNEVQVDDNGNETLIPITEVITALVNEVRFEYTVETNVRIEIYLNYNQQLIASETFNRASISQELEYYLLDGNIQAVPPDISLNNGSPFTTAFHYNYDYLIEDALEQISEDVERYLENW